MKHNIKIKSYITLFFLSMVISSCSRSAYNNLVGNGRDEHGCLSSAGYQWSYAKNDCVRIWEAGERFESQDKSIFVIFSEDSLYAEIFAPDKKHVLCKRKKTNNIWTPSKGKERVSISNGVMNVHVDHYNFTKTIK